MRDSTVLQDIFGWDIWNWARALEMWEAVIGGDFKARKALELGAGGKNGGISLWLALSGAHVICSNITGVTDEVALIHKRYGVSQVISYANIDALKMEYKNEFDIIAFRSVLGAIGRHGRYDLQCKAIKNIYRALKQGGVLLLAENLTGSRLHMIFRNIAGSGRLGWRYISANELTKLLEPFSKVYIDSTGVLCAFCWSERWRNWMGRIDRYYISRFVPHRWHYIGFAVAIK